MSEPTYEERERGYLIKVIWDADREACLNGRKTPGDVVFRKGRHMAAAVMASGFVHDALGMDQLTEIMNHAEREWYSIMRPDAEGCAVPAYGEHMADAILAKGFRWRRKANG